MWEIENHLEKRKDRCLAMKIGNTEFDVSGKKHYIMGILNVTPDSFSDGGTHNTIETALRHTERMIDEGAHMIDVGGESTRPGYTKISDQEEIERIAPVIEKIKTEFNIPISLDTYKSEVAKAGLAAGADLINDIWGLQYDGKMADVIAAANCPCCLMHNRREAVYGDFPAEYLSDMKRIVDTALSAGIKKEQIILDPGIGFGKDYQQNLETMAHLEDLVAMGYPVLLGTSRKSMIGLTLDLPVTERVEGTLATTVYGCMKGVLFFRVHDVKENARALRMTEAMML